MEILTIQISDIKAWLKLVKEARSNGSTEDQIDAIQIPVKQHIVKAFDRGDALIINDENVIDYYAYDKPNMRGWDGEDVDPRLVKALDDIGYWYEWETCENICLYKK